MRAKNARVALRDIMHWLDRINETDRPAQLQDFLSRYVDADAQSLVDQLVYGVATDGSLAHPEPLIRALKNGRKRWREKTPWHIKFFAAIEST